MSLNRYNPKRDANEAELVHYLRKKGCSVMQLSGAGLPDLLVGKDGVLFLAEVKMPGKRLTEVQKRFYEEELFPNDLPVFVITDFKDCSHMLTRVLDLPQPKNRSSYADH